MATTQLPVRYYLAPVHDDRVAELLADGLSLTAVAARMGVSQTRVEASFARICARLGGQAR